MDNTDSPDVVVETNSGPLQKGCSETQEGGIKYFAVITNTLKIRKPM